LNSPSISGLAEIVTSIVELQFELTIRGTVRGKEGLKVGAKLAFGPWRDSAHVRTFWGREGEGDTTKVVIQVDDRIDFVRSKICVDLAHQFEFWTDFEDAMIGSN
jgi:hypothetical protein